MAPSQTIAVIGEALIDMVETGDDDPRLARPGGSPYNVAIGLARLGRPTAFVGRIADDPLGSILRRHAQRSNVDLSLSLTAPEPGTVALVELDEGRAEYRFGVRGTADFAWTDAELAAVPNAGFAACHFGSLASWTPPGDAALLRWIARLDDQVVISYDPNVRPRLQPDRSAARVAIEATVPLADLVKTSDEDLAWLYPGIDPADVARRWLGLGPDLIVVTRGSDGSSAHTAAGSVHRPVAPVEVVDTVGAGDAFTSGLLDALARRGLLRRGSFAPDALLDVSDDALGEILDDAALIAGVTCSRAGANPPRVSELGRP